MTQESNNKIVKSGIAIGLTGTLLLFVIMYILLPQVAQEILPVDRITLAIKCTVFPALFLLVMILRIGSQRFGNSAEDPTKNEANTENMKIDLRVLSNTHEQIVVYIVNVLALSVLLPYQYLSLLPIYSAVFVVGRIIFWVGYRHNVLWRAPGFAMSTLPAVSGFIYCGISVLLKVL